MAETTKDDGTTSLILGGIVAGLLLFGLWYISKPYLVDATHAYRAMQVRFFMDTMPNHSVDMLLPDGQGGVAMQPVGWATLDFWLSTPDLSPEDREWVLARAADVITPITKWPALVIMGGLLAWAVIRAPGTRFRTRHTLESLIDAQAQAWPVISPIVKFNPAEANARAPGTPVPRSLPSFAEALSPIEFVAYHRLGDPQTGLDDATMTEVFAAQLGPRWDGAAALPSYKKALFAAFALKGARKRSEADELLGEIAPHWSVENGLQLPKPLLARIDAIIDDKKIGGVAEDICWEHAYTTPALVRLLLWCREQGGVLAPAQFLWLRAVDRALWYPLNNAGRQAFHPEASGAMAHYMAEQAAGRPLIQPKVNAAKEALIGYLQENPQKVPPLESEQANAPGKKKKKGK